VSPPQAVRGGPDFGAGLRSQRLGLLLSLLATLSGFSLGGVFGAWEEGLEAQLQRSAEAVLAERYGGDEAAAQRVVDRSFGYYTRAHMHWGGIGAATLAVSLLVAGVLGASLAGRLASLAMGLGALLYPSYWLLAGRRAPGLGGTGAAKDSLEWLAVPAAGLLLLGTAAALVLVAARLFGQRSN